MSHEPDSPVGETRIPGQTLLTDAAWKEAEVRFVKVQWPDWRAAAIHICRAMDALERTAAGLREQRDLWVQMHASMAKAHASLLVRAESADAALADMRRERQWIAVTERLPDAGARVIVCAIDSNGLPDYWIFRGEPDMAWAEKWKVIKWMVIPE